MKTRVHDQQELVSGRTMQPGRGESPLPLPDVLSLEPFRSFPELGYSLLQGRAVRGESLAKSFVAEDAQGEVLGFIIGEAREEETFGKLATVSWFYICSPQPQQHLSKNLFAAIEGWFVEQGCQRIIVDSWQVRGCDVQELRSFGEERCSVYRISVPPSRRGRE